MLLQQRRSDVYTMSKEMTFYRIQDILIGSDWFSI